MRCEVLLEMLLGEVDCWSPLRLQQETWQMPEDGPVVGPELVDVVRPQDLVSAALAEPEGGADTEARGAGRADAVRGGRVVAGPRAQVQPRPGLAGQVGHVDVGCHGEGDVGDIPVIPVKQLISIPHLSALCSNSHSYWDAPLHGHLQLCCLHVERMRNIEFGLVFSEGEGDLQLGSILINSALRGSHRWTYAVEVISPVCASLPSFLVCHITKNARLILGLHQFNKERSLSKVESRQNHPSGVFYFEEI